MAITTTFEAYEAYKSGKLGHDEAYDLAVKNCEGFDPNTQCADCCFDPCGPRELFTEHVDGEGNPCPF